MAMNGLGWTFDTVADTYEKLRPGYVNELYRIIFDYAPINNTSRVVEIGIGGGQFNGELAVADGGVVFRPGEVSIGGVLQPNGLPNTGGAGIQTAVGFIFIALFSAGN